MRPPLSYDRSEFPETLPASLRGTPTMRHFRAYTAALSNLSKRNIVCRANEADWKRLEPLNYCPEQPRAGRPLTNISTVRLQAH